MYTYKARVVKIIDGDTFDAIVDLGFDIFFAARFRLSGIDTPETWRPRNKKEKQHGLKATEFVKETLQNKTVLIQSEKDSGIYGRYTASIIFPELNNKTLSELLIENGFEKKEEY